MATKFVRPIRVEGNLAFIPLTQNQECVIDAGDVQLVAPYNWYAVTGYSTFYAARKKWVKPKVETIFLHRLLLSPSVGIEVDHIDGDGLNNRRCNLRLATRSENARNVGLLPTNTSGFKGVSWHSLTRKWRVEIHANGRQFYIGVFETIEDARDAYCEAAKRMHGQFARTA